MYIYVCVVYSVIRKRDREIEIWKVRKIYNQNQEEIKSKPTKMQSKRNECTELFGRF